MKHENWEVSFYLAFAGSSCKSVYTIHLYRLSKHLTRTSFDSPHYVHNYVSCWNVLCFELLSCRTIYWVIRCTWIWHNCLSIVFFTFVFDVFFCVFVIFIKKKTYSLMIFLRFNAYLGHHPKNNALEVNQVEGLSPYKCEFSAYIKQKHYPHFYFVLNERMFIYIQ